MVWEDRVYVNPKKVLLKNMATEEIVEYEVQDDPDNIVQEGSALIADNLNNIEETIYKLSNLNIITDEEYITNELKNGNRVYGKRIDCGYLNSGTQTIPHGLTNIELIRYAGIFKHKTLGTIFNIPRSYPNNPSVYNVDADVDLTNINIIAGTTFDGATFRAYMDIYYIKI